MPSIRWRIPLATDDAFRKQLDTTKPLRLLMPSFEPENNWNNEVYQEDANELIRNITCDVIYLDPPYNSRTVFRRLSSLGKSHHLGEA